MTPNDWRAVVEHLRQARALIRVRAVAAELVGGAANPRWKVASDLDALLYRAEVLGGLRRPDLEREA